MRKKGLIPFPSPFEENAGGTKQYYHLSFPTRYFWFEEISGKGFFGRRLGFVERILDRRSKFCCVSVHKFGNHFVYHPASRPGSDDGLLTLERTVKDDTDLDPDEYI
uniref:Uncharacterized protein n=1 Tax=Romanomermis culicivorax TaxID=13658 RepID=A0A915IJR7_ROMCU